MRNLRSVFGIGVIWGVLWASLAILLGTVIGIIDPADIGPGEEPHVLAPAIGLVGFVCGIVFAGLLSVTERGDVRELSLLRVAVWGLVIGAALPLVAGKGIPEMIVTAPLGAMSAIASVAILRRWTALPVAH